MIPIARGDVLDHFYGVSYSDYAIAFNETATTGQTMYMITIVRMK